MGFNEGFKKGLKKSWKASPIYQRTIGDYKAVNKFLRYPSISGATDLYTRSKQSQALQRGLFKTAVDHFSSPKRKAETSLPSPPPTKKTKRAQDKLGMPKKYTKTSRSYKKKYSKRAKVQRRPRKTNSRSKLVLAKGVKTWLKLAYKPPRKIRDTLRDKHPVTYQVDRGFTTTSAGGQQGVWRLGTSTEQVFSSSRLKSLFNTGSVFYDTATPQINQEQNPPAGYGGRKFYVKSCTSNIQLVNQGPTTCKATLYILTSRNTEENYARSSNAEWAAGLIDTTGPWTVGSINDVDAKPTDAKGFNMKWNVVKKVQMFLNAGQEHVISYKFQPNRWVDYDYVDEYDTIKGITHEYLLVQHGLMGDDTANWAGGSSYQTPTKLAGSITDHYTGTIVRSYPRIHYQVSGFTAVTPINGGAATKIYGIVDASGATVDTTDATNYA